MPPQLQEQVVQEGEAQALRVHQQEQEEQERQEQEGQEGPQKPQAQVQLASRGLGKAEQVEA